MTPGSSPATLDTREPYATAAGRNRGSTAGLWWFSFGSRLRRTRPRGRPRSKEQNNVILAAPREVLERAKRSGEEEPSGRDLEIVLLAGRGLSNRRIAEALHLSEATMKRHLANIYAKIRVNSRSEATRKALSEGWISARDLTDGDGGFPT